MHMKFVKKVWIITNYEVDIKRYIPDFIPVIEYTYQRWLLSSHLCEISMWVDFDKAVISNYLHNPIWHHILETKMAFWTLLSFLPYSNTYSITTPTGLQLSEMPIIMKTTYNESFVLKVSNQELCIDGVSLVTYHLLRRGKFSHMYNKVCTFLHLKPS